MMYEEKLLRVLVAVIAASVPFFVAALKNRLGMGLAGTFATVVGMKFGGLWIGIPVSAAFTIFALVYRFGDGDKSTDRL